MQQLKICLHYNVTEENCHFPFHLSSFHHKRENTHNVIREIEHENIYNGNHIYYKHFHFIDFPKYGSSLDQPLYVNIIRDPVDHYISWYFFRSRLKAKLLPIFGPIKWFDYEMYNKNMMSKDPIKLEYVVCENCDDCAEYYTSNEWSKIKFYFKWLNLILKWALVCQSEFELSDKIRSTHFTKLMKRFSE